MISHRCPDVCTFLFALFKDGSSTITVSVARGSSNWANGFKMEELNCLSSETPFLSLLHVPQSQNYHPLTETPGTRPGASTLLSARVSVDWSHFPFSGPASCFRVGRALPRGVPHADFEVQRKSDLVLEAPTIPGSPHATL